MANHNHSQMLREKSLKVTPLRLALLTCLFSCELPREVTTLAMELRSNQIKFDQVTLYRNLETFVEKGLAKKVDLHNGKYYYEQASNCSHLICNSCGRVEHLHLDQSKQVQHEVSTQTGFKVSQQVNDFFGTCKTCQP